MPKIKLLNYINGKYVSIAMRDVKYYFQRFSYVEVYTKKNIRLLFTVEDFRKLTTIK